MSVEKKQSATEESQVTDDACETKTEETKQSDDNTLENKTEKENESLEKENSQEVKLEKKEEKLVKKEKKAKERADKKGHKKGSSSVERYNVNLESGLSQSQVENRINQGLVNKIERGSTQSVPRIIFKNLFTFFNLLTFTIAGILIAVGAWTDIFFMVIVTANIILGIIQQINSKNAIDKLSLLSAPTAIVLRDGRRKEIAVDELVLDDILLLETGKQISSDAIVMEGSIEVNESLLTGESDSIIKRPGDTLFSGSYVVSGNCKAKVDKIGKDNYIEKLAGQAKKYKKPKSELMRSLSWIIYIMAVIIVPIGMVLFYIQYSQYTNPTYANLVVCIRKTAGAMIGMIPSGLYLLTSLALAAGVIKLAQKKVLVQELYCIEMLARVDTLCLDKTGTITDGTMSVKGIIEYQSIKGLKTEKIIPSLLAALNENNLTAKALEDRFGKDLTLETVDTIPFSSQRKWNAVTFKGIGTFVCGAPEFVLGDDFERVKDAVNENAAKGYRVLSLVFLSGKIAKNELPQTEKKVISLILIEDNIRPDAIETIEYFKNSGVDVRVISGDNPLTVSKIAERAGIENAQDYISLDGLEDGEVIAAATKYTVFGRVSPAQKRLIVQALKSAGRTVAMTGDGVNDILALKEADCSIAVASGSEAARNVSHLVLMDSNFATMPGVVSEGRRVINNVAKVACLFLTKTLFSLLLAIQAINSKGTYPISTNQLMLIDFFVTGIPSFILALEPNNTPLRGNFLKNVLKGAVPGAITILIDSIIIFGLKQRLNMNATISSTLIVIVATHTCMMVLFKVCKPYNVLRRTMCSVCYAFFLIGVFFFPNFFEFAPIAKFMEYYDPDAEIVSFREMPDVTISKDGYYVVDGVMTTYASTDDGKTPVISTTGLDDTANCGYYTINGKKTEFEVKEPTLSLSEDGYYVCDGFVTSVNYVSDYQITVDSNGEVYVVIGSRRIDLDYNILPEVKIGTDGKYIIGGKPSLVVAKIEDFGATKASIRYDEELDQLQLYINSKPAVFYDKVEDKDINYVINMPVVSMDNNKFVIGGTKSIVNVTDAGQEIKITMESSKSEYLFNGIASGYPMINPKVEVSSEGKYVINGFYSSYEAKGRRDVIEFSATEKDDDGNRYLVINGNVTDQKVVLEETIGGTVNSLPLPLIFLLVALCLLSAPFMNLLTELVPWIKKQVKNISHLLAKF